MKTQIYEKESNIPDLLGVAEEEEIADDDLELLIAEINAIEKIIVEYESELFTIKNQVRDIRKQMERGLLTKNLVN